MAPLRGPFAAAGKRYRFFTKTSSSTQDCGSIWGHSKIVAPLRGAGRGVAPIMGYPALRSKAAPFVYPILAPRPSVALENPYGVLISLHSLMPSWRRDLRSLWKTPTGAARSGRQTLSLFHEDTTINERSLMVCPVVLI